jgi:hypothetical protein
MRECNLRRLLGHGAPNFSDTVSYIYDRCLPGSIEKLPTVVSDDPATLSARGHRNGLLEIAGEKSAARQHELSGKGL